MAKLQTMPDLSWTVRCWNASNQFRWLYVFSRNGNVRWKDEGNGMTGTGTWQIRGDKLYTRWHNSGTVETWKVPIDTSNWTGDCVMKAIPYSLHAIARNFVEVDTDTIYTRTPESKAQFLEKCSQATGRVQIAQFRFSAWLSSISIAYGNAFEAHNRLLGSISATEKLAQDMLLGFALAFLGGGVGGSVGAAMKAAESSEFMIDGIKDLAKFSVRGPGSAAVFQASSLKGMPSSPLQWQNSINEKVASEMALVAEQINDWRKAVATDDQSFNAGFDPVAEVDADLTIRNNGVVVNFRMLPTVEKEELQRNFEKGWLVAWIKNCGESVTVILGARASVKDTLLREGTRLGMTDIKALVDKHIPIDYDPNWSATGY